jgi:hypothetical protein
MSRAQKQTTVRLLDEHGAFLLRGAVDDVASWMGVSRVTLYSYLNAIHAAPHARATNGVTNKNGDAGVVKPFE